MNTPTDFLRTIDKPSLRAIDRARALLWWVGQTDPNAGMSTAEICKIIEETGHPRQNVSRLSNQLSIDKKFISRVPGQSDWRLHPRGRNELDALYTTVFPLPQKSVPTDSVLPRSLFAGSRRYIERVVLQINASYDNGLFDCCAVMCRRLLETLIIEIYENVNRADDIRATDGNFYMFSGLLSIFEGDSNFNISRNSRKGLHDFKNLGDLSAHNRRFNARKEDIDRIRDSIRIASEELLHMADLL